MTFYDYGILIDNDTKFVLFGIPWDYLTSIKAPNSSIAPKKIREVTFDLALTTELGLLIPNLKVVDIGDVKIIHKEIKANLKEIKNFVDQIYEKNKYIIPVMIGGDHFCTFPVFKAIGKNLENKETLGILLFDSHLDLYNEWDKRVYSHATVTHRIYDLDYVNNKNLLIVGTRDIDIPEIEIAKSENITYFNSYILSDIGLDKYINNIITFYKSSGIESLYISIDIDVLDPSIAPATGFPIPGGFTYREFWKILKRISKEFKIIGFDLVEVAPNLDLSNHITSNLAAKLIIEFISFISIK
ncbi:MAG: agmatinase [Candidatus Lokiarchaeota archaeon]|nr:agmatinase [Candidatus Lokiarchaeota archaeon]